MKNTRRYIFFSLIALLSACSGTKFVPEGSCLLDKVTVRSDQEGFAAAPLVPYVSQTANSKWFSLFKIPLGTYSLAGRDTTKWLNRTLQSIGEAPVIYDTLLTARSMEALRQAMRNMGYMHAEVGLETKEKKKHISVCYVLKPGERYTLGKIGYDIEDDSIAALLKGDNMSLLRRGAPFTVDKLDAERKRITSLLMDKGY